MSIERARRIIRTTLERKREGTAIPSVEYSDNALRLMASALCEFIELGDRWEYFSANRGEMSDCQFLFALATDGQLGRAQLTRDALYSLLKPTKDANNNKWNEAAI